MLLTACHYFIHIASLLLIFKLLFVSYPIFFNTYILRTVPSDYALILSRTTFQKEKTRILFGNIYEKIYHKNYYFLIRGAVSTEKLSTEEALHYQLSILLKRTF